MSCFFEAPDPAIQVEIDTAFSKRWKIFVPIVFTSEDDMLLLTGTENRAQLKLPDFTPKKGARSFTPQEAAHDLLGFLFTDGMSVFNDDESYFLGTYHRNEDIGKLTVPIVVDLDTDSQDERLRPSRRWTENVTTYAAHFWIPNEEVKHIPKNATNHTNRRFLKYFIAHETELDSVAADKDVERFAIS